MYISKVVGEARRQEGRGPRNLISMVLLHHGFCSAQPVVPEAMAALEPDLKAKVVGGVRIPSSL
jgi:hypothetical protein